MGESGRQGTIHSIITFPLENFVQLKLGASEIHLCHVIVKVNKMFINLCSAQSRVVFIMVIDPDIIRSYT